MAAMCTTTELYVRVTPAYAKTPLYCDLIGPTFTVCLSRRLNAERALRTHGPPDTEEALHRATQ